DMRWIFSPQYKFQTWRRLWVALAEAEAEAGLDITEAQIQELRAHVEDINFDVAEAQEKKLRHDVMAHIYAYGEQCPTARGIIHLGATSAFVGDNTDLIQMREGLHLLRTRLVNTMHALAQFAMQHRALVTVGYTHFQPAQLTTVGRRAVLWLQDLTFDLEDLEHCLATLHFHGSKGATGTQASFLQLCNGDEAKVKYIDQRVAEKMGFARTLPVTGQTYPRKYDSRVLSLLSGVAQSAHKFSNDIRLLQSLGELEEPFGKSQVGSSTMAYKRNPMRSERMASLARHVICTSLNPAFTAAGQWFERTLDDSANKRLSIPEAFLGLDAILILYQEVVSGLVVYPAVIARRVAEYVPFLATENLMMEGVKAAGDRQVLHEKIRQHAMDTWHHMRVEGGENDLLQRLHADRDFTLVRDQIPEKPTPEAYIGRAVQQVDDFLADVYRPIHAHYQTLLGVTVATHV
ncbi:MAG: adenylosuccinate lyase, partial [Candidatus Tectomicrobia bacterium]|nr:adenylosuccinate lyase [Candidatus Tectomicrobia bacterium]